MGWACFPQIYVLVSSLRIACNTDFFTSCVKNAEALRDVVLWTFEISSLIECGRHERKWWLQSLARGMRSEVGSISCNSSASSSGVWNEGLWFPYSLCSLFITLLTLVLSFHFRFSYCLGQFLSYFSVCQMFTFLEGFLDFYLGRGKFFVLVFASLPTLFNLLLKRKKDWGEAPPALQLWSYHKWHISTMVLGLKKKKLALPTVILKQACYRS